MIVKAKGAPLSIFRVVLSTALKTERSFSKAYSPTSNLSNRYLITLLS
jgi:hypothetical protein